MFSNPATLRAPTSAGAAIAAHWLSMIARRGWFVAAVVIVGQSLTWSVAAQPVRTIEKIKPSIVAVGTFQRTRSPQYRFLGTGFAVAAGNLIATNAHVLAAALDAGADPEVLVVLIPGAEAGGARVRRSERVATDAEHDVALLRIEGPALPALALRDSATVAEGDSLLFTGFPIGGVLGMFPATHRAMIAAISPIAIPSANEKQLDPRSVRRLRGAAFPVFQLDATAFPGNSGSPLYDPADGKVVGVINMVFVKGTKESALSQPSGITYAIPSRHLIELLEKSK